MNDAEYIAALNYKCGMQSAEIDRLNSLVTEEARLTAERDAANVLLGRHVAQLAAVTASAAAMRSAVVAVQTAMREQGVAWGSNLLNAVFDFDAGSALLARMQAAETAVEAARTFFLKFPAADTTDLDRFYAALAAYDAHATEAKEQK